jgi:uncharacterized protein
MSPSLPGQPAAPEERFLQIDVLRGLALFGVLMVNLEAGFRVPLLESILQSGGVPSDADRIVEWLISAVLEFKAIAIFSFLFGAGIAIQTERFASRQRSVKTFLVRRLGSLFLLGAAHLTLLWNGDILALYAVCGLALLPSLTLRWPLLVLLGGAAMMIPHVVSFGPALPSGKAAAELIAQARDVYGGRGFISIMRFRWQETWALIVPLLVAILPRTIGLMYWGMAGWRSGILREPEWHRGKLAAALGAGILFRAALPDSSYTPILLAMAYVAAVLLWLGPAAAAVPGLVAMGRMALTNYLLQSLVLGFLFYGYGLGLFGRVGSAAAACLGLVLYAIQVQVSRLWLDRFRFGPVEWLWRSLAYGRRPPMRKTRSPLS